MSLKEILQKLVNEKSPVLLCDQRGDWEAANLLHTLPEPRLKTSAYLQPGLYIAEIDGSGFLGRVLFKFKTKAKPAD